MLLTNHALTGVLLGLTIDNPVELAVTGVASHLVLDALPHFGYYTMDIGTPLFVAVGTIDFCGAITVTALACIARPERAWHILLGAVSAALPDLIYIPEMLFSRRRLEHLIPGYRGMRRFLGDIQWYERPLGLITEVFWATLMLWLISARLV